MISEQALCRAAVEARERAYAPYSDFRVGAALLTDDGMLFTGCNIENASYGVTVCAERVALFSAIAAGKRRFAALALAGGKDGTEDGVTPCGMCRQALAEFCDGAMPVLSLGADGHIRRYTLSQLLPEAFGHQVLS